MALLIRRLVSVNKLRYQKDGFDLDLSYITPRLIAMGFPAEGLRSLYRNPMSEAARFLGHFHAGHFKVYNLCIEAGYGEASIGGPVQRFMLYDGQAPPVHLMQLFCEDAAAWLQAHPSNVVVVHCKAGKGRTGALVVALLLHLMKNAPDCLPSSLAEVAARSKWQGSASPQSPPPTTAGSMRPGTPESALPHNQALEAALGAYNSARTRDGKGLTIYSQVRYVQYFHAAQLRPGGYPPQTVRLCQIQIMNLPSWILNSCTLSLWIRPTGHHEASLLCHIHVAADGTATSTAHGTGLGSCMCSSVASADAAAEAATALWDIDAMPASAPATAAKPAGQEGVINQPSLRNSSAGSFWHASWRRVLAPGPSSGRDDAHVQPKSAAVAANQKPGGGAREPRLQQHAHAIHPTVQVLRGCDLQVGFCGSSSNSAALTENSCCLPPLDGDIKVQLFRGHYETDDVAQFKGARHVLAAWLSSAFLPATSSHAQMEGGPSRQGQAPGCVVLEQYQLDKVCKPLRIEGRGVRLRVEYDVGV